MNRRRMVNRSRDHFTTPLVALGALVLAVASCGGASVEPTPDDRPVVIATTSILGDVLSSAFGDSLQIEVLIAGSQDPHSYQPSPEEARDIRQADVVFAVGLGLEEALVDVLSAAASDGATVVYLGEYADPLPLSGDAAAPREPGALDPHFWMDPERMALAVAAAGDALADLDPANLELWRTRADAYVAELDGVDVEIRAILDPIPPDKRKLVTNHDSLRYFADAYGFEVIGTVLPGASTIAEPSASDLAELVELIDTHGVPAIFADTTRPARLAEVVAAEARRDIAVVSLRTGSLGEPGGTAATYFGYLRTNAELILQALTG